MKRILATVVILILFVPMFPVFMHSVKAGGSETTIFQDDFESYAVGTFPSAGGWQIVWNGAGNQYQVTTSSYSHSGTKSLQLIGADHWSSVTKRDFSSSSDVIGYEGYMMTTSVPNNGSIGFFNQYGATWGVYYAGVGFSMGNLVCGSQVLQPITPYTWYKVRVTLDKNTRLYNVSVNDVLAAQNLVEPNDPHGILSLEVSTGWFTGAPVYFDDVKVFEVIGPSPTGPVISSVSPITATNLQTIYIYGSGFGNTQPQTVPAYDSDGSVDTVASSTTPCMGIGNNGVAPDAWAAGVQNASNHVHCAIGIYLTSWSDTEIVLGGFGSALNTNGQGPWNIAPGDKLDIAVFTPSGEAHYGITVAGAPTVLYAVGIEAGEGGSVSYSYDSASGSVGSGKTTTLNVASGTQISLTASPSSGSAFQGWQISGLISLTSDTSATTSATVNGKGWIEANFALLPFVGIKNLLYISNLDFSGAYLSTFMSIQQNFVVETTNPSKEYWVQNVVVIHQTLEGLKAAAAFQIWDIPPGWLPIDGNPWPGGMSVPFSLLLSPFKLSLPMTLDFTSVLQGGKVVLSNPCTSWSWPIPGGSPNDATIFYGYPPSTKSPEFVLVGIPHLAATFSHGTNGHLDSYVELGSQPWTSSLVQAVAYAGKTTTGETSSGLGWTTAGNTASFFNLDGSDAEGVFFAPTASATIESGAAAVVQAPLSLSIDGSSALDGTLVAISMAQQQLYQPSAIPVGIIPAAYYDVIVQGISDGTAAISIMNDAILSQTAMQYWNGAQWVMATDVVVSGNTVCGDIPVSALGGTPIAIGPLSSCTITFDQLGVGSDFNSTVLIVDSTPYNVSALPVSFIWTVGSMHSYAFQSPLTVTADAEQYAWTSTTGLSTAQSGMINVTGSGSVTADYASVTYVHDVAVTNVTVPFSSAYQGWVVNITVTVANLGNATENFTTTLDYDGNTIGVQPVLNLAPNATLTLPFSWNTTYVPYSYAQNYTITATASTVPGETNTNNNQLSSGQIQIRMTGDANGDGIVNMKDVALAIAAFNSWPSRPRWNYLCDLDQNGLVNMRDIVMIVMNFKHS